MIAARMGAAGGEASGWLEVLEEIPPVSLQESLLGPVRKALMEPTAAGGTPGRRAMMLARMDYAANFSGRGRVIDEAVSGWQETEPVAVADFLAGLGLYQRLLESFPEERVAAHPGLFPRVLEAMERTGAWGRIGPLLDAHGQGLPKFEELARRAIAAARLGDSPQQVQLWDAAMSEAKSGPQATSFLALHRLAREAGMQDEADAALVEAIRLGRGPLPLYADLRPLLNSLARQGRENVLLEICAIYLALEPGNPVLLTQYAYLACLNNLAEPKLIIKALEPLAKAFPKELPIQCVLATAYLCDGQAARAAERLDPLKLDPAKLAPGYRAAFLSTQVLVGRIAKDDPQVTGFPWKSLQGSERRKFSELIEAAQQ